MPERRVPTPPGFPRRIGGVEVENPIFLAPLAGITVASVRAFFRERGAGLVHTEMVSAAGLIHENRKTRGLLEGEESERPLVLQLFAPDAETARRGAEAALAVRSFEALEVNFACPMPKIAGKGSGAALLGRPEEAARILAALVPLGLPVWAKLRLCPPRAPLSTAALCGRLLEAGAAFLIVHGRTPAQRYEGRGDRSALGDLARAFLGRIGASGDVYGPEDARDYLERGAEAVLAARGFLRDPFVVGALAAALAGTPPPEATLPARAEALRALGDRLRRREGDHQALTLTKKFLLSALRGFPGAAEGRDRSAKARSWPELEALLASLEALGASAAGGKAPSVRSCPFSPPEP